MLSGRPNPALVLLVSVVGLAAATRERDDDPTFFETVEVRVVNVEVVVTDRDGEPVYGLTRDDFELLEDGRPVEITNFYSVEAVEAGEAEPQAPTEEAVAVPATTPAARPTDQELHLAVFVDGTTLVPLNRRRVLDAVRDFFAAERLRPTSLVLATYDGALEVTRLERVDADQVDDYVEILAKAAARGAIGEMTRRSILRRIDRASPLDTEVFGDIEAYAGEQYNRAIQSMQALESLVEALASLPGRKALVYVSGGLPRNPGEALFHAYGNKFGFSEPYTGASLEIRAKELDTGPELLRLSRYANANRVTFYSVGAGRGGQGGGVTAEEGGGYERTWNLAVEAIDNSNQGGNLQELAAATGGRSMTNSYNFEKLFSAMSRDLSSYYSLGYSLSRERDGKNHRLRVRVNRRVKGRKVDVRHREHYRELTRAEVMGGLTRSALLLGGQENPLQVRLQFGRVAKDKRGRFLVPIMIKVPLARLVLVPQGEAHLGRIGIFVSARDGEGRVSPAQSMEVPIRIPAAQLADALGQVAGYRMVLRMRPQEHTVAVAVRDELGQAESTVTDHWQPPAAAR